MRELYKDPDFTEALEQNKANIAGYHDGAGLYGPSQKEVVLEISSVTQQEIYSMGGHSSPFEDLIDTAEKIIFGRPATQKEREGLILKAKNVRSEVGPSWLSPEATQKVLKEIKPPTEQLREIKSAQDRVKR